MPSAPIAPRPLIVTTDAELLDELVRLAAAAGVEPEVAPDAVAARRQWTAAPMVLVGTDATAGCAVAAMPRRRGVALVSRDLDDATVWQQAVTVGAEDVYFLPDAESWLVDELSEAVNGRPMHGFVLGVVGGRGGAGASTLATALAVTAMRTKRSSLLVDADPLGGGLDLLLGAEGSPGMRWPELATSRGLVARDILSQHLPRVHELTVLSWDRSDQLDVPATAMRDVLDAGARSRELVVVDLPRRLDEAAEAVLEVAHVVLLVVPAEVRACAAAARVATAVQAHCPDVRVVVRGPAPAGLDADVIAASLDLRLAGQLRPEPGLAAALERGEPPARRGSGPLSRLCGRLLDELLAGRDVGPAAA